MELTENLTPRQIRNMMGKNQDEFGKLIGMTGVAVMRRENGKVLWKMHEISKVSVVSGVPIERIRC